MVISSNIANKIILGLVGFFSLFMCPFIQAAVLPEDRADILYHAYSGGGVDVNGPSILVRKKFLEKFSVSANYYVDFVTSASIDVETTASAYEEERTQYSVGMDYLTGKTTTSFNFTNSTESDYEANTMSFGISQDFFGDLTTIAIGYAQGDDTVMKNGQADFIEPLKRQNYSVTLTQILTKNFLMNFAAETITDDGFLNNPYRSVRFLDPSVPVGYSYQLEQYPATKTSTALALRGRYFLPYRAAVSLEARAYNDTWGVAAQHFELGYVHPYDDNLILEATFRSYKQDKANFYSDLFPFANSQNFFARDKELSTYTSNYFGLGATYEFKLGMESLDKVAVSLFVNYIRFQYDDFRNLTVIDTPGAEPLYEFDATVIRAFVSIYY
jgi:hypothetical protein